MKKDTAGRCMPAVLIAILAGLACLCGSCSKGFKPAKDSLRAVAAKQGITVGFNLNFNDLNNKTYTAFVGGQFSSMTPDNHMKWDFIHPQKERYEWFFADGLLALAEKYGMQTRGHVLVWHQQLARWVLDEAKTKDDILKIVDDHCFTIVDHYKGRIGRWDVVNEPFRGDGSWEPSIFYALSGKEFVDVALKAARRADPKALLYINEVAADHICPKSDALYELCKDLLARKVPLDGVGFQAHFELNNLPDMASVKANVERFAALGLRVDFTELDVRMEGAPTPERLELQAGAFADIVKIVMETDGTNIVTFWGPDDGRSWVPRWRSSWGSATMLNRDLTPKPAFTAVKALLGGK
jgi:endo-1,4-beta-xylanase